MPIKLTDLAEVATALANDLNVLAERQALRDDAPEEADVRKGIDFYDVVKRFEIRLISIALNETNGNQRRAAKLLGLNVTTLNSKLKRLGMIEGKDGES